MCDTSVCVVGNARSIVDSGLGPKIDSHDVVIRCNLWHEYTVSADVGKCMTHLILAAGPKIAANAVAPRGRLREVWIRDPNANARRRGCAAILRERFQKWQIRDLVYNRTVLSQDKWQWLSQQDRRILLGKPTTGLVAIAEAVAIWPHCTPIAFAGFGSKYPDAVSLSSTCREMQWPTPHNIARECELLNTWEERGLVRRLDGQQSFKNTAIIVLGPRRPAVNEMLAELNTRGVVAYPDVYNNPVGFVHKLTHKYVNGKPVACAVVPALRRGKLWAIGHPGLVDRLGPIKKFISEHIFVVLHHKGEGHDKYYDKVAAVVGDAPRVDVTVGVQADMERLWDVIGGL